MSSKVEEYKKYLEGLDLSDAEKEDLIGAMEHIVESLLNKKYSIEV